MLFFSPSVNLKSLVTFSISLAIPVNIMHVACRVFLYSSPWRSAENLLETVALQIMIIPHLKHDEQIDEILLGTKPWICK